MLLSKKNQLHESRREATAILDIALRLPPRVGRRAGGAADYPSVGLGAFSLQHTLFLEAHMAPSADHDMIEHLDAEEATSLQRLLSETYVFRGR
jgi:hypothetical protein